MHVKIEESFDTHTLSHARSLNFFSIWLFVSQISYTSNNGNSINTRQISIAYFITDGENLKIILILS